MICRKLIQDGELTFFKRTAKSGNGNAVHDKCRKDTGGDWFARDCYANYVRDRFGAWRLVIDYDQKAKNEQTQKVEEIE